MMYLEVNGEKYSGFEYCRAYKALDKFSGRFDFNATSDKAINSPVKEKDRVYISIDDTIILDGFVEKIKIRGDKNSHSIAISGRDKTGLLISSDIPNGTFNAPITLEQIANKILKQLGVSEEIDVINEISNLAKFTNDQVAEVEEKAFAFLEKLARKANVLLTTDFDGNIVITRNVGETIFKSGERGQILPIELIHVYKGIDNNVQACEIDFDETERYNKYTVYSQPEGGGGGEVTNQYESEVKASITDSDGLTGKYKNILMEQGATIEEAKGRVKWEKSIRRANALVYSATVKGFYYDEKNSKLWMPNQFVNVTDEFAGIKSKMLIKAITYEYSLQNGSIAVLDCVDPEAFKISPVANTDSLGWGLKK